MTETSPRATADAGGRPLWLGASQRAGAWKELLGTSDYLVRHIRYGIRDLPIIPFTEGRILPPIPQTEADKEFASADLSKGLREGIYEEVSSEYAMEQVARGRLVSSSFVVWQGDGSERKGRFVVNLHLQSQHWKKGSIKMETLPSFALELEKDDFLFSFDIHAGYRHFYLHPQMRDYFLFHYGGRYYRCIALPFGWGRSPMWFTKFMRGFVRHLRTRHAYRVLPYIDDFLVAAAPAGRPATEEDAAKARAVVSDLFNRLGLVRKVGKGCWEGSRTIDHLGMHIDTEAMRVFVANRKVLRVRQLSKQILLLAQRNRRLINRDLLEHFCGVCVALSLALPLARFYTRSLYFDMAGARMEERGQSPQRGPSVARISRAEDSPSRVRLSRQSLRDLRFWRQLTRGEGRELRPCPPDLALHSDAADVGWGGTLGPDLRAGSRGLWEAQGFWSAADRVESITLRELRAVRLLLHQSFSAFVSSPQTQRLLVHEDNQSVVYVLNAMVSASKAMMAELRKLQKILVALDVRLDARWLPSAVNRYADSLSRKWNPADVNVSEQLLAAIQQQYNFDRPAFCARPLNEPRPARLKQIGSQMQEWWGDGKARLWNPPFDFLPLVVRKIQQEGGQGVLLAPFWPAQAWFGQLRQLATTIHVLDAPAPAVFSDTKPLNPAWQLIVADIRYNNNGSSASAPPSWTRPVILPTPAELRKPPDCSPN